MLDDDGVGLYCEYVGRLFRSVVVWFVVWGGFLMVGWECVDVVVWCLRLVFGEDDACDKLVARLVGNGWLVYQKLF